MEIWKPIPGYEFYEASSEGRIRSVRHYVRCGRYNAPLGRGGHILKPTLNHHGYEYVSICCGGKSKKITVHRLVAMAFLPNPDNLPAVNHKDETRTNNRPDNLEWCTNKYNSNYGTLPHRLSVNAQKYNILKCDINTGEVIERFDTCKEAAASVNTKEYNIRFNVWGRTKSHAGFIWKYEEVEKE